MTEDEMLKFLQENKADIAASVKARAVDAMTQSLQWQLPSAVQAAVSEFFTAEIIPELVKSLSDQKGPIIEAAVKASTEIGDAVAKSCTVVDAVI